MARVRREARIVTRDAAPTSHVPHGGAIGAVSPRDASPAPVPKLELRGIAKTFRTDHGDVEALAPCDLAVREGELVMVVGPSGCGKSTLMSIAAGLEAPTSGEVRVDGRPAGPAGPQRTVVFQRFALFPSETVEGNIAFGLTVAGVARAEREARVAEQLELMGLARFRRAWPHELSGGMQQRVAIARALAVRPEILLMDEPFGALDAQTRTVLQGEISRLRRVMNYTVLFITHSVEEAVYLGDRVVVMSSRPGRIRRDIAIPHDEPWRGLEIEDASMREEFIRYKREIWELIRTEIVRE
jgi:NitT/TauT family transport system ATP-binding protein